MLLTWLVSCLLLLLRILYKIVSFSCRSRACHKFRLSWNVDARATFELTFNLTMRKLVTSTTLMKLSMTQCQHNNCLCTRSNCCGCTHAGWAYGVYLERFGFLPFLSQMFYKFNQWQFFRGFKTGLISSWLLWFRDTRFAKCVKFFFKSTCVD